MDRHRTRLSRDRLSRLGEFPSSLLLSLCTAPTRHGYRCPCAWSGRLPSLPRAPRKESSDGHRAGWNQSRLDWHLSTSRPVPRCSQPRVSRWHHLRTRRKLTLLPLPFPRRRLTASRLAESGAATPPTSTTVPPPYSRDPMEGEVVLDHSAFSCRSRKSTPN